MNQPHYPGGPTDAELLHPPGDPAEQPENLPGPPDWWMNLQEALYQEHLDDLDRTIGLTGEPAMDLITISEDYGEGFARFAYPNEVCIL